MLSAKVLSSSCLERRLGLELVVDEVEVPSNVFLLFAALISDNIWLAISMDKPQKSGTKCWHFVWQVIAHSAFKLVIEHYLYKKIINLPEHFLAPLEPKGSI